jgi:outer membrane protein TolC
MVCRWKRIQIELTAKRIGNHHVLLESKYFAPMPEIVNLYRTRGFWIAMLIALFMPAVVSAQIPTAPAVPANAVHGSITSGPPVSTVIQLSLDDAVRRGLQHNLAIIFTEQNQRAASGEKLVAINYLLPNVSWKASRSRNQINLATLGFRASTLKQFPPNLFPPSVIANIPAVVTVNEVAAQASLDQTLFDLRSIELYRAAKEEIQAVDLSVQAEQGAVIQQVADSYLQVLAAAANVQNAQGLLATNAEILRQANLEHQAGTIAGLDALRARVQYQQQEQSVIAAQNAWEKTKVTLNREIGLPADQAIELTDTTPYAGLEMMPLSDALREAYRNRPAYHRLQAEMRSADLQERAARYERLPTLNFSGNYGLTGTVGGIYHGTFLAQGTLNIPLFREAKFRGDHDVANAALRSATSQLASFRGQIEAQVRDNMLDVAATEQLVNVARNNVDLAHTALGDATDRFRNGIDDDLPVVQAQASLAGAEAQLVNSLYQYNAAKLALARSVGIIDREYRDYLGTAKSPGPAMSSGSANQAASSHSFFHDLGGGAFSPAD